MRRSTVFVSCLFSAGLAAFVGACLLPAALAQQSLKLGDESVGPAEASKLKDLVEINLETGIVTDGKARRAQHTKHHGLVSANFIVLDSVSEDLRHGVFAVPGTYKALIRFSNGRQTDDQAADAHGMAIKLYDVTGQQALPERAGESTQDFILVDHEVFFLKDMSDYLSFNRRSAAAKKSWFSRQWFVLRLAVWDITLAGRLKSFAGQTPSSPLASDYWSTTPYRLGGEAVKYMADSPLVGPGDKATGVTSSNGLSVALVEALKSGSATFDFGVHVQTDPAKHPVEDATLNWSKNGAQFVKLATIEIPQQAVDPNDERAENIAFNPWNALEAHRPLGAINRGRLAVYRAMSKQRHDTNGVTGSITP